MQVREKRHRNRTVRERELESQIYGISRDIKEREQVQARERDEEGKKRYMRRNLDMEGLQIQRRNKTMESVSRSNNNKGVGYDKET